MRKISRQDFYSLLNRKEITLEEDVYVKETIHDKILKYLKENTSFTQLIFFSGEFNGNGHTIYNAFSELFYEIGEDAVVKNLTISDVDRESEAVLCKKNKGTVENVTVENFSIEGKHCGGITKVNFGEISDCEIKGKINGYESCGGVSEFNQGVVENCSVTSTTITGDTKVGGITGWNIGEIRSCTFSGRITGSACYGGIVGLNENNTIYNCSVTNSLILSRHKYSGINGGGVCGVNRGDILRCDCVKSEVNCDEKLGGICGTNEGLIKNTHTNSKIDGGHKIGGLVGKNSSKIKNCSSEGLLDGDVEAGVFTGQLQEGSKITSVISSMDIVTALPGCCFGNTQLKATIENCYYYCDYKKSNLTAFEKEIVTYIPDASEDEIKTLAKL